MTVLPASDVAPQVVHKHYAALSMYRIVTRPLVQLGLQGHLAGCLDGVGHCPGVGGYLEPASRSVEAQRGDATGSLRACMLGVWVVATVDLDWVSHGCCRVAKVVSQQKSHGALVLLKRCRHASSCPGTVADETEQSLIALQMEKRVWAMVAACFDCWAAMHLWEVTCVTVMPAQKQLHRLHR